MKTSYESKHENACLKRCVLRGVLKKLRSFTALIFDGNLFQSVVQTEIVTSYVRIVA